MEPSTGEANWTPSSVMLARCNSETICKHITAATIFLRIVSDDSHSGKFSR